MGANDFKEKLDSIRGLIMNHIYEDDYVEDFNALFKIGQLLELLEDDINHALEERDRYKTCFSKKVVEIYDLKKKLEELSIEKED